MTAIEHFLASARRGAIRGASGGDHSANILAKSTLQNLTHYASLDSHAREGLAQIIHAANNGAYESAADILERIAVKVGRS